MSATIKDIAELTGLGIATISKYINGGNVLDKNKAKIDEAIEKLNFHVNGFARGLKTQKSKTVGVVIPELTNIFGATIISTMEDILRRSGYGILICDCRTDERLERDAIEFLLDKMVDGIINMPVSVTGEHLIPVLAKNIPVVLIDRKIEGLPIDAVLIDNMDASGQAMNCLIDHGHRKIGIICGPKAVFTTQERLAGYRRSLEHYQMEFDESLIEYGNYTVLGGYESMKRLYGRDLSAVFVTNYEMTLGAIIAVNEMGIRVPDELSFIGFDNLQLSQIVKPKLTIVYQPLERIAGDVAGLMIKRLQSGNSNEPRVIKHATSLLQGDSVRKIQR